MKRPKGHKAKDKLAKKIKKEASDGFYTIEIPSGMIDATDAIAFWLNVSCGRPDCGWCGGRIPKPHPQLDGAREGEVQVEGGGYLSGPGITDEEK